MGTQKTGSQGGGGSQQERRKSNHHHHQNHALGTQGSLYSLTLDEIEHQLGDLGRPLSSMNLDELLKSVCTAEEANNNQNQGIDGSGGGGDYAATSAAQHNPPHSLHRQSSLTLSRDLSKKTVDEVWQHILLQQQQQQNKKKNNTSTDSSLDGLNQAQVKERQPTLGEMTLEDFLVKAGVVAESAPILGMKTFSSSGGTVFGADPIAALPQPQPQQQSVPQPQPPQVHWMSYQQQQQNMLGAVFMPGHPLPISANPIVEVPSAYPETQMAVMTTTSPLMGTLSDTQTPGRKRVASGAVTERTVERRQKRMIKNRESAARSRARKQAYTQELENKVSRLEEENERLKRQKEVEKILPCIPPPEPKYQLRRTSSAPF